MIPAIVRRLARPASLVVVMGVGALVVGYGVGLLVGARQVDEIADRLALAQALAEKDRLRLEQCEEERVKAIQAAAYYRGRHETLDTWLRFTRGEHDGSGAGIGPVGGR